MKITVCDFCKENKSIFYHDDEDDVDACELCYHDSDYYEKTPFEDYYGFKIGRELNDFDTAASWDYKADGKDLEENLNMALNVFGIVVKFIDGDSDSFHFGFKSKDGLTPKQKENWQKENL